MLEFVLICHQSSCWAGGVQFLEDSRLATSGRHVCLCSTCAKVTSSTWLWAYLHVWHALDEFMSLLLPSTFLDFFKHDFSICVAVLLVWLQTCSNPVQRAFTLQTKSDYFVTLLPSHVVTLAMARSFQCPVCRGRVASCFIFSRSRVVDRSFDWCSPQPQTDNLLTNTLPPSRIMTGIGRFERWLSFGLSVQS